MFVLQLIAIWPFTVDDMYIPLRYARNWSEGYGLVWNINEPPVEGYTSFIFLALGKFAIQMGLNPVFVLKIAGAVGLFITFIGIYLISRLWFTPLIALIPSFWMLFYKGQIIWSVSGFETTVYQSIFCFSVYFILKGLGHLAYPQKRGPLVKVYWIMAGILLGLGAMTRPEMPGFVALFLVLMWMDKPRTAPVFYRNLLYFIASFIFIFAPYFIWRWTYFGHLFPNSVSCKGLSSFTELSLDKDYLILIYPLFLLIFPAIVQEIKNHSRKHYFLWIPSVVYGVLLIGADPIVAFYTRLFLPVYILLLPLVLLGIRFYFRRYLASYEKTSFIWLASVLLALFFIPGMKLNEYRFFTIDPQKGENLRLQVVDWLNNNVEKNATVVLGDTGLIPYKSSLKIIDSYCLNNLTMGMDRSAQRIENFCKKTLKESPQIIILTSLREKQTTYAPADACIQPFLLKDDKYQLVKTFSTHEGSGYTYEVFKRMK
ncbi:glycosyltransferase family 39 protein [Legionella adelaidensis]|uniref:glycosyltransferase family 39 protein n=1 Tax=Legionella adelaidensis TaxID=45056 RepID=UPI001E32F82B|nr:glycosyltransferase family 39 protein [Legionella adelaidensis]